MTEWELLRSKSRLDAAPVFPGHVGIAKKMDGRIKMSKPPVSKFRVRIYFRRLRAAENGQSGFLPESQSSLEPKNDSDENLSKHPKNVFLKNDLCLGPVFFV